MVNDTGGKEEEDENDMRPVEELVVTVAERFEGEEGDDRQKYVRLSNKEGQLLPCMRSETLTHRCTSAEAVPLPHRDQDGASEGILVDHELIEPGSDVTG